MNNMNGVKRIRSVINVYLFFSVIILSSIMILLFKEDLDIVGVQAQTVIVDDNGQGDYLKIQDAIDNATPGDTIYVWSGVYYENITINKSINLIGNGTINTTIDGGRVGDVVKIEANWVNVTGFNITNGSIMGWYAGIKVFYSFYNRIESCKCSNSYLGIYLVHSSNNNLNNNSCNLNTYCDIYLEFSNNNTLNKNKCSSYYATNGIEMFFSKNNTIDNNLMSFSGLYLNGDLLDHWNTHTIFQNNYVNGRTLVYLKNVIDFTIPPDVGQVILANCTNIILENQQSLGGQIGIALGFSNNNSIQKNNCSNGSGISLQYSSHNKIVNNTASNESGIFLYYSSENIVENNSCSVNYDSIRLQSSSSNIIKNNICKQSKKGIWLINSSLNMIENNICQFNSENGIILDSHSNNNIISNNTISSNYYGIGISYYSQFNKIFHNDIINSFMMQAYDSSFKNTWNNSQNEGNYWSFYTGLDNGDNGRIAGDGIGDTKLPHNGLDYYPFMISFGWIRPAIPTLHKLESIDNDGNYILSWNQTWRTTGYILEEDGNITFESPSIIYRGSNLFYKVIGKTNGTYYYRLKAYNLNYESEWSNTEMIKVDWLPNIPRGFNISSNSSGNVLTLSWDINKIDTISYHIEFKNDTIVNWKHLTTITHPNNTFIHHGLMDGIKYYYRIQAEDSIGQKSNYSKIISGIPLDIIPPKIPTNLTIANVSNNFVKLTWESNEEFDLQGYNIYKFNSKFPLDNITPIGSTIKGFNEFIDRNLNFNKPYYYVITAFDEVPNESEFSDFILGPFPPEINNSIGNLTLIEDSIDQTSINLFQWFKDINNDPLAFWCEGMVKIDISINQTDGSVKLIPVKDWNGQETITFYSSDGIWNTSSTVNISITPINDPPILLEIISPENNTTLNYSSPIDFIATCFDPDIIYGDVLTFVWSSNISGEIGNGGNISGIILEPGYHEIMVIVTDLENLSSYSIINIIILSANISINNQTNSDEPDVDDDVKSNFLSSITIFLLTALIVFTIIIIFLIILRKKVQDSKKEKDYELLNMESKLDRQIIRTEGELIYDENEE